MATSRVCIGLALAAGGVALAFGCRAKPDTPASGGLNACADPRPVYTATVDFDAGTFWDLTSCGDITPKPKLGGVSSLWTNGSQLHAAEERSSSCSDGEKKQCLQVLEINPTSKRTAAGLEYSATPVPLALDASVDLSKSGVETVVGIGDSLWWMSDDVRLFEQAADPAPAPAPASASSSAGPANPPPVPAPAPTSAQSASAGAGVGGGGGGKGGAGGSNGDDTSQGGAAREIASVRSVTLEDRESDCPPNEGIEASFYIGGELCVVSERGSRSNYSCRDDGPVHTVWCGAPTSEEAWRVKWKLDLSALPMPVRITAASTKGKHLYLLASSVERNETYRYFLLKVWGKDARRTVLAREIRNSRELSLEGLAWQVQDDTEKLWVVNDNREGHKARGKTELCVLKLPDY